VTRASRSSPYRQLPGGATLYATDEGDGQALLFVHGWTCDSSDYLWQVAWFRSTHRVIAPDLRGHGRSAVPADGYDSQIFARDLAELLDALAVPHCIAIGHSLGALVVSILAADYPERVRGVVCLDPAYGLDDEELASCHALTERLRAPDWPVVLADAFGTWEWASTPAYFRELHVRRMLAMDRAVVVETFRGLFDGNRPLTGRTQSAALLARRTCPVLSLHSLGGRARAAWESAYCSSPSSLVLHLPLGHWPHHDAPELVNHVITQWLLTLPPSSTPFPTRTTQWPHS